ncbi:MAG TPA: patatin-like phospholipase family protein [Burkholderiales bacterium]|nr:patatin-like phospholipase family protein [Burkholderiales bacterium]
MNRRRFVLGMATLAALPASRATPEATVPAGAGSGVALVLGGGGCRGYGHIGVLRVLGEEGLKPSLVVGSSVGALVGALYAAGMDADALERAGAGASHNLLRSWIFPFTLGMFSGDRIRRFVESKIGRTSIEMLPMPFAAVATNLRTGKMRIFRRGAVGTVVQASASAPGLLEPVEIDGELYAEGALTAPVPVSAARELGAARVLAVDVSFPPEQADLNDPFDALYQGFSILTRNLALEERAAADVALEPPIPPHNDMKPATLKAIVEAGEEAARSALPAIRNLFGNS